MQFPELPDSQYVYIIQNADEPSVCKIGRTNKPVRRMSELGIQLPFDIAIVRVIPCSDAVSLETELHRKFINKRVKGEWFRLDVEELKHLLSFNPDILHQLARPQSSPAYASNRKYGGLATETYIIESKTSLHNVLVRVGDNGNVKITWSQPFSSIYSNHANDDCPATIEAARTMADMLRHAVEIGVRLEKQYQYLIHKEKQS